VVLHEGEWKINFDGKMKHMLGRIVKTTGDGLLVQFAIAMDAMCCAVDIQRQTAEQRVGI
jgi:class 3 adenylate cyclase